MSFILDALKRAERERKLEKAPDLSAIYQEERFENRKYQTMVLVGRCGSGPFGMALVAILFWPKESFQTESYGIHAGKKALSKGALRTQIGGPQNQKANTPVSSCAPLKKTS
jgi:hypothetical protein